jgi:hypothetical protein
MAEPQQTGLRTLAPEQGEPSIIRQILNKIPEHNEQAMADEYYGEYPEKTTDTAIGILSAFPVTGIARMGNFIRNQMIHKSNMVKGAERLDRLTDIPGLPKRYNRSYYQGPKPSPYEPSEIAKIYPNMFKDPAMLPFFQSLGLFMGKMGVEDQKRARRKIEAEEMGLDSLYDHPELQKKADGGEIDPFSMLDPNPDLDSIPDTPKLDSIAKFFLPVTEEGELSKGDLAFEMASMFPMLFWMKGLKLGSKGYKQAGKIQDEIEDLKDLVTREKINAPTDGAPATNAAFRAQQNIGRKENELLRLVREQDPKYADLVEEASRRRVMDLTQKADPLYDNKIKSGIMTAVNQGGDELFDIAGNLKDPKYNKILEEGYRKNRNIANEGIGSLQKLIKDALTKKPD